MSIPEQFAMEHLIKIIRFGGGGGAGGGESSATTANIMA